MSACGISEGDRVLFVLFMFVAADKGHGRGDAAGGQWDAQPGRDPRGGTDPGDHFCLDMVASQVFDLIGAAPEDQWVSAF